MGRTFILFFEEECPFYRFALHRGLSISTLQRHSESIELLQLPFVGLRYGGR